MKIRIDSFGLTDIGRKREVNEDQFLITELSHSLRVQQSSLELPSRRDGDPQGALFVVADGLGGHSSGERASRIALDGLAEFVLNSMHWPLPEDPAGEFERDLREAVREARARLVADVFRHPECRRMATTLTLAFVVWPRLHIVHVGDSRCYLWRDGHLQRLTHDHTLAQKFVDRHWLTPREAEQSPLHHRLWNALCADGGEPEPELHREQLRFGDKLLLCTDGLTQHLDDKQLAELVAADESAEVICRRLVDAANAAGGEDNITVVLAGFQSLKHSGTLDLNQPATEETWPPLAA